MRTITAMFMFAAGVCFILGAIRILDMSNFDPALLGLGISAITIAAGLYMKVWVDKPNDKK
jgi:hypothetical protein